MYYLTNFSSNELRKIISMAESILEDREEKGED